VPAISSSFDQRSASTKSTAADARSFIKVEQENSTSIELYYEDHGSGSPVVSDPRLAVEWRRMGKADRRIIGRRPSRDHLRSPAVSADPASPRLDTTTTPSQPTSTRYFARSTSPAFLWSGTRWAPAKSRGISARFGTQRLRKAVLIGTLGPYLVKAPDNPEGIDASVFSGIQAGIKADRPAAMMEFLKNFYSVGGADGKLVSDLVIQANWTVAIGASPIGTRACVDAWIEDFRNDISHNDLPTMMIHGDDDRILPADATS